MANPRGFTLIELLVVIAIIGLLSSIVLASLTTANQKALDAARMADTKSLETAMQSYYFDHGTFPKDGTMGSGYAITTLQTFLVPEYIGSIPSQLITDSDQYVWLSTGGSAPATGYGILIRIYEPALHGTSGFCKTGTNTGSGEWGSTTAVPFCPF